MDDGGRLGWWTISGVELLQALHRVNDGGDPEMVYAEMYANSDVTNYGAA